MADDLNAARRAVDDAIKGAILGLLSARDENGNAVLDLPEWQQFDRRISATIYGYGHAARQAALDDAARAIEDMSDAA